MKAPALLEHLFGNHQYCGEWCGLKMASKVNMVYVSPEGYLYKENNKVMYEQLKMITTKYGSPFFYETEHAPI